VPDEPFELILPSATIASSIRWTCFCARSRSFFNCWTIVAMNHWDPRLILQARENKGQTDDGVLRIEGKMLHPLLNVE
jgi:hypothetical protein